ncbi:F-box only protein 21 [Amphibalanus amphitrite]|uniref:F-box only protein 21 n=1 Tax=Amphibalanus amphitrite TaxID=1232801 RepID=A0A6A4WF41_AMPAM|nr:F-box only protein 21 [Amphibalanus amphitrite]
MLDEMGNKYFTIGGLPDPAMQEMKELVSRHCTVLVKDQLLDVLDTEQTDGFEHISRRHYARMLYRELHRDGVLLPLFREFMQRPSEHVNIPEATHLIDQWITPERRRRNASELQHHYQHIAALCLRQLRAAAPHHPAAAWARCKADPFGQTLWSEADVLVVLDAVNAVLYDQLDLLGDQDGRPRTGYAAVAHQLFCGVDAGDVNPRALLSALYATVAGLLGVNMFPVRFPGNSLLRWQTRDGSDSLFVSVMRAGLRQTRDEIMANPYLRIRNVGHESFEPIPRHELLNRLVVGIMAGHRTAHLTDADLLSLNALAVWSETDCRLGFPLLHELSEVFGGIRPMYIHDLTQEFLEQHDGTLSEEEREGLRDSKELMKQRYEQILQELRRHKEVVCLRRNAAPVQRRFRVGDIVRHRRYHYHAVVAGWTERCDATEVGSQSATGATTTTPWWPAGPSAATPQRGGFTERHRRYHYHAVVAGWTERCDATEVGSQSATGATTTTPWWPAGPSAATPQRGGFTERHRRYHYHAVVAGWTERCDATEVGSQSATGATTTTPWWPAGPSAATPQRGGFTERHRRYHYHAVVAGWTERCDATEVGSQSATGATTTTPWWPAGPSAATPQRGGFTVRHRRYHYHAVVAGWTERCDATEVGSQSATGATTTTPWWPAGPSAATPQRGGFTVRHRRYHYHAVVAGWTERCDATEGWIEQMGVDRLPLGRHQPFFNVLAEDRTTRYAADGRCRTRWGPGSRGPLI